MTEKRSPEDIENKVRELLGRATLARAHGETEQALAFAQESARLDENSWESHELIGDLLMELDRAPEAMQSYRRARQLAPDRPLLEDKIARAALRQAADQEAAERSRALLEGTTRKQAIKRQPAYAALLSALLPGLGQIYNGQMVKGLLMLSAYIALCSMAALSALQQLATRPYSDMGSLYAPQLDAPTIFGTLFSGVALFWAILVIGLWIYSLADAALRASRSMTSDDTGLV